jgi:hypothetical protein
MITQISFKPTPTQTAKCTKLKLNIILDDQVNVAGGKVRGRLDVVCNSSKKVHLGEISVELSGVEEILDKDHALSQSFLSTRIVFQGERMPPSSAVRGKNCGDGYYLANKGKTGIHLHNSVFPFAFDIPAESPASYAFQNTARLQYIVTGAVKFTYRGSNDTLFKSKETRVVDRWDQPSFAPVTAFSEKKIKRWGDGGEIKLEATLGTHRASPGTHLPVEIRVDNGSKSKIQGIKVAFVRKLTMLRPDVNTDPDPTYNKSLTHVMAESKFMEKCHTFTASESRIVTLYISVPVLSSNPA